MVKRLNLLKDTLASLNDEAALVGVHGADGDQDTIYFTTDTVPQRCTTSTATLQQCPSWKCTVG